MSSKGAKLLNKVSNAKLRNTIKELYRPGEKVGDGGLSDAIRHEIKTGSLVGGKSHIKKGTERLKNLERISKRETLTKQERKIVEDLIKDLKRALGGK
ncbi:MAG: type IV secretion protein Rhs [Clostridia bacterium]|nr:type IV secretion protein Rhs [Clostridia bacterium]